MSTLHQISTLQGMAVLRQWDDSTARGYREISAAVERLDALPARWHKDADQYMRQVEETSHDHDQMLSVATALRQCARELEESL